MSKPRTRESLRLDRQGHALTAKHAAVADNERAAVQATAARGTRAHLVHVLDIASATVERTIHTGPACGIALASDAGAPYVSANDRRVAVVDPRSGRVLKSLGARGGLVRQLVTSADGSAVYGADELRGVVATARR